jgi:hypothetical protein
MAGRCLFDRHRSDRYLADEIDRTVQYRTFVSPLVDLEKEDFLLRIIDRYLAADCYSDPS